MTNGYSRLVNMRKHNYLSREMRFSEKLNFSSENEDFNVMNSPRALNDFHS